MQPEQARQKAKEVFAKSDVLEQLTPVFKKMISLQDMNEATIKITYGEDELAQYSFPSFDRNLVRSTMTDKSLEEELAEVLRTIDKDSDVGEAIEALYPERKLFVVTLQDNKTLESFQSYSLKRCKPCPLDGGNYCCFVYASVNCRVC